ncbi:hypothetical protein [Runella sp.]|jgi:hypothetical protein|uniref:hypothetical protein n=1 Tax=Runella sp. TaxID=1960881 RepID=UPI003019E1A5
MAIFDKINSFLNSSCLDLGYIVITFFIIMLVIAQFSLLITGLGKAIAGRFALEYLILFFNILGNVYSFSGIESALSNNCPKLDLILKIFRNIGWFLLFIEFLKEGGFELLLDIVDFFLDVFNTRIFTFKRRPRWGVIKVFLLWGIPVLIASQLSQIMNNYIRWLCNCLF